MLGEQLWWLVLGLAAVVLLGVFAAAGLSPTVERRALLLGARNGLLVAISLVILAALAVALLATGQRFLWGTLDLGGAISLGLLAGLALGIGYFWLGATLMAGGLLLGGQRSWATRGAWLTAPVAALVFVSAGGFALAMAQRAGEPAVAYRAGELELRLAGGNTQLHVAGAALCEASSAGTFEVFAGEQGAPALAGPRGMQVALQLTVHDDVPVLLAIRLGELAAEPGKGWEISPATVWLSPGWTRAAGQASFAGVVPLDPTSGEPVAGDSWQGTIDWTCAR